MSSDVENIKSKLSITDVVGSYIKLEKAGANLKARCPFHGEKTASFFVSPTRGSFHCFGCNVGGDIFSFVQQIESVEFRDALQILADKAGIKLTGERGASTGERERVKRVLSFAEIFYNQNLSKNKEVLDYLKDRGITDESIDNFKIGYAPSDWDTLRNLLQKKGAKDADLLAAGMLIKSDKGGYDRFRDRIIFPIYDYVGSIIGFGGRLVTDKEDAPKYINSPETIVYKKSRVLYGIDRAKKKIREKDRCVLVEGYTDVILSHQAGVEEAVAVSGTAFTEEHVEIINRLTDTLVIVLDGDSAGFSASSKAVRLALAQGMYVEMVPLPEGTDPADIASKDPKKWEELVQNGKSFVDYALEILEKEGDKKSLQKSVRDHVYPFLALMKNSLFRDESLQKVATVLSLSADAVRDDYRSWTREDNKESSYVRPEKQKGGEAKKTKRDFVLERLIGILFWQKQEKNSQIDFQEIENKLKELLEDKNELIDLLDNKQNGEVEKKKVSELVFEAESYYNDSHNLHNEIQTLVSSLERELLQIKLEASLAQLRTAEKQEDNEKQKNLLEECHSLMQKINDLEN